MGRCLKHPGAGLASNGACRECGNIYSRGWRKRNPEKVRTRNAEERARYVVPENRLRGRLSHTRSRAKKLGLQFDLKLVDLLPAPVFCPVLGMRLNYGPGGNMDDNRPSLDRVDNTKGYTRGNVRVISLRANSIKKDATAAELRAVAEYAASGDLV